MATLDDSPSLFSGQQWADWADAVMPDVESDNEDTDTEKGNAEEDSMKLKFEDMPLFGLCPSRDEFYLVVCDKCGQVLKPQALQSHLEIRHGGKGSFSMHSSSKTHQSSSRHSVSSKSHSKTHSPTKSHSRSSYSKSHSSSSKLHRHGHSTTLPLKPHKDITNSGADVEPNLKDVKQQVSTKSSVMEPPPSFDTAATVGAIIDTETVKNSHLISKSPSPVVKVERMPDTLAMKKQRELNGNARTSLTNGSLRDSKSPPKSMPVITDIQEPDIKEEPPSPIPELTPALEVSDSYMEMDTAQASEINSAVSSILEPMSPVPEPEPEPGGLVALATSSTTITTNTVTMATLTTTATNVTSVMNNSTSSFKFNSIGRPNLPMGSIRVNFTSTGVLNTVSSEGSASLSNLTINNNVAKHTSSISDSKPSIVSNNSNMESTISDIVKSAVNSGNAGGFKSLSPLLSSPPKSTNNLAGKLNNSFKSPSAKISSMVKPIIGTGLTKPGSKLSPGAAAVFKASSGGTPCTQPPPGDTNVPAVNTEAIEKFQMIKKPDKIIPLKDREYDPNKHCGVVVSETGKACTRSLTCKSHALSLRRAVTGRRLPFDELLQEHRDAKEAYIKAKNESKEAAAALKAVQASGKGQQPHTIVTPLGKATSVTSVLASATTPNAHIAQALTRDGKSLSLPQFSTVKPAPIQRPASISSHRTSFSSIGSPSSQDELQSPTGRPGERIGGEEEEDSSYTTYHPRPIAACSFGARYHNSYGSRFGCHTFGRKTDYVRAIFLDMLDKHANPSPPKKLCVEANLPRENDQISSDPYEFGFLDSGRNLLGQQLVQGSNLITSVTANKVLSKQKPKSSSTVQSFTSSKPKIKDTIAQCKSITSVGLTQGFLTNAASAAKKRRGSGSAGALNPSAQSSIGGASIVTATPSILGSVGALSQTSGGNQQQFAIAIPSVNISAATLSQIGASLVASGNIKHAKNNVIKDMGFYVTGIPQEAIINGQLVNITNSQISQADIQNANPNQIPSGSSDDGSGKAVQQVSVISNKTVSHQPKFINNIDIRALQLGKGGLITGLPPNAVLLDSSNLQPGAVLQPVTLTSTSMTQPMMSAGASVQGQPSTYINTIRTNMSSPMVSTSTVPNGVISNQTINHAGQGLFPTKGVAQSVLPQGRGPMSHGQGLLTGGQLQNITFHTPHTANQMSANPNSVLPGQIHIKNSALPKSGTVNVNKLGMQPMSITIPFVTQNNLAGGGGEMAGQHHTLYITGEDSQKSGLHMQQQDLTTHSSPNNSMIS